MVTIRHVTFVSPYGICDVNVPARLVDEFFLLFVNDANENRIITDGTNLQRISDDCP